MDIYSDWTTAIRSAVSVLIERVAFYLPTLLGAVVLLVAGWIIARLLRVAAVRFAHMLDRMIYGISRRRGIERPKVLSASADTFGSIVFWVVLLLFVTAATHVLGLDAFLGWLDRVVAYLPTLAAGGLIILAGFLVSALARDLTVAAASSVGESQRALLGRSVQVIILLTAIVIGADQIGVKVTFLVIMATVFVGALMGGMALAVSLGARTFVSNLIGGHALKQAYRVGQTIRMGGHEGRILDLTPTFIVLETTGGRVTLPAKIFNEEPSVLVMGKDIDD